MELNPADLGRREQYALTIRCVIPRPIGWTSTLSPDGTPNLAPFSFFGGVSSDPPTVMLSVGRRRGVRKDTAENLLATKEAVIHIPSRPLAEKMVLTSKEAPPETDEIELAGLTKVKSSVVRPWRVKEAAVALEAKVVHHQEVGTGPVDLFLLEVVRFHLADEVLVDGKVDPTKLEAVGRLGGPSYCDTSQVFDIPRPG